MYVCLQTYMYLRVWPEGPGWTTLIGRAKDVGETTHEHTHTQQRQRDSEEEGLEDYLLLLLTPYTDWIP
jgi:hypothetical protein